MVAFPSIRNPHPSNFSQQQRKVQLRSEFESGPIQSRAKFTRMYWIFTLGWPENWALPHAEYDTLVAFFNANQGGHFTYTHWITGGTYDLHFMDDVLPEAIPVSDTHWAMTGLKLYGIQLS